MMRRASFVRPIPPARGALRARLPRRARQDHSVWSALIPTHRGQGDREVRRRSEHRVQAALTRRISPSILKECRLHNPRMKTKASERRRGGGLSSTRTDYREILIARGQWALRNKRDIGFLIYPPNRKWIAEDLEIEGLPKVNRRYYNQFWPDQVAYTKEVLARTLSEDGARRAAADMLTRIRALGSGVAIEALSEEINSLLRDDLEKVTSDPDMNIEFVAWGLGSEDQQVRQVLKDMYATFDQVYADAYRDVLPPLHLRLRDGINELDVARALNALVEGLALRNRVEPDAKWAELYIKLVWALIAQWTEPVPDGALPG